MNLTSLLLGLAVAATPAESALPDLTLPGTDGHAYAMRQVPAGAKVTVLVFFSSDCPVQKAHDARLKELAGLRDQGVQVFLVDSEAGASVARDKAEASARGYPFPILIDDQGRLAEALKVRFSTTSLLIDSEGQIRYRGGIDKDSARVRANTPFLLKEGAERMLAGKQPDPAETKALGCYLKGW